MIFKIIFFAIKITIVGNDISEFNLMRSGEHTFEIDGPLGINEKRKLMLAFGKDNRIDEIEIQAIPVTLTVLCNLDKGNIKLNRLNGFDSLDSKSTSSEEKQTYYFKLNKMNHPHL